MISYYDLLGLIKEGKQPKEVSYMFTKYKWDGDCYITKNADFLVEKFCETDMFNEDIEIDNKIKKIDLHEDRGIRYIENNEPHYLTVNKKDKYYVGKINEIIDKLNSMEDKDE